MLVTITPTGYEKGFLVHQIDFCIIYELQTRGLHLYFLFLVITGLVL